MLDIRSEKLRHGEAAWVAIRDILLHQWDPIGVSDEPHAQDEYDSYLPGVRKLLATRATEEALIHHLDGIATERMGFPSQPEKSPTAAIALLKLIGTGFEV